MFVVPNQSLENALRTFHAQVSERSAMQIQILKLLIENIIQIKNLIFKWFPLIYTSTTNFVGDVQSLSHVRFFVTPWTAACKAFLSFTVSWSLLKLMSIESVMPSNHLILCHPLLLPLIFPRIRVFSSESVLLIRWPEYWSFSLNIGPSNEHSGLISFRMDWLDLLAVQGTLKSLLQ